VTQPVCCTDLRTSRFLAAGTMLFRLEMIVRAFLSERTLKTVANYRSERGALLVNISCQNGPAPPLVPYVKNQPSRGLPGRANAIIRSRAGLRPFS
jgi:hypothetical protein